MFMLYIYFYMMILMFLFNVMFSVWLFVNDQLILLEWLFVSVNSFNIEFLLYFDWVSFLFISFVLLISSMILLYSSVYMMGVKGADRYLWLLILFIFSMIMMVFSPNIISILVGWDGLGLVSYCLVIFYQNYLSFNSGMVTVLCNRLGDVGILMGISMMLMSGAWNKWMLVGEGYDYLVVYMLVLAAITKSAQIPFSTWLPAAMAAPTPISALVHSSTLVTAGVYLMIRFNSHLTSVWGASYFLFLGSILTMFMAGLMANLENDLKKIIALSTLSQLGLMMMILSVGGKMMAFYHLLTHAIFKSMLFMCAGIIIHIMVNNQDIRLMGGLNNMVPFTMMSFFISNMALSGFPFLAGFYSKDLIMEFMYNIILSSYLVFFIVVSLMFTISYSLRVLYYVFFGPLKFYSYFSFNEDSGMNLSMSILIILSISVGAGLNWMFLFDTYVEFMPIETKMLTLSACFVGCGVYMVTKVVNLGKMIYLSYYFSSMWFLNYLVACIYSPIINLGIQAEGVDKKWFEFTFSYFFNWRWLNKYYLGKIEFYKVDMLMFVLVWYFIMILMFF